MNNEYVTFSPAGISGINIVGARGIRIKKIIENFSNKNIRIKEQKKGLYYGILRRNNKVLDEVLIALTPENNSLEISSHGGKAVRQKIISFLEINGFKRTDDISFWQGTPFRKDIINAVRNAVCETGAEHFLRYLDGSVEKKISGAVKQAEKGLFKDAIENIRGLKKGWGQRNGFIKPPVIYIIGPENSGKSTLFNRIIGFERVIVTEIPGTTSDYVDETVVFNGYPFTVVDTQGFTGNKVEDTRLIRFFSKKADYFMIVNDTSSPVENELFYSDIVREKALVSISNKSDRTGNGAGVMKCPFETINISALYNQGIDTLMEYMSNKVIGGRPGDIEKGLFTNLHVERADKAVMFLENGNSERAIQFLKAFLTNGF